MIMTPMIKKTKEMWLWGGEEEGGGGGGGGKERK
jgi:hypothetical protein